LCPSFGHCHPTKTRRRRRVEKSSRHKFVLGLTYHLSTRVHPPGFKVSKRMSPTVEKSGFLVTLQIVASYDLRERKVTFTGKKVTSCHPDLLLRAFSSRERPKAVFCHCNDHANNPNISLGRIKDLTRRLNTARDSTKKRIGHSFIFIIVRMLLSVLHTLDYCSGGETTTTTARVEASDEKRSLRPPLSTIMNTVPPRRHDSQKTFKKRNIALRNSTPNNNDNDDNDLQLVLRGLTAEVSLIVCNYGEESLLFVVSLTTALVLLLLVLVPTAFTTIWQETCGLETALSKDDITNLQLDYVRAIHQFHQTTQGGGWP
jgi:hypothetical protein